MSHYTSQVHQGLPFGTYSPKRRPHLLTSLPTSFMKFLVMTALPPTMHCHLQWTDEPTLNQNWVKEHKSHSRLHLHNPDDFSHNQSAPAHHSRTTGHKIAWDRTTILTITRYKTCNWTSHSQNTQSLKQETLHSTVQTVPLNAVNSGTPSYPKYLAL